MSANNSNDTLPAIEKTISHAQIRRYANASGDFNPVHLDEQFAANSSFGRIVAHGMMTLAFISEMMTAHFRRALALNRQPQSPLQASRLPRRHPQNLGPRHRPQANPGPYPGQMRCGPEKFFNRR